MITTLPGNATPAMAAVLRRAILPTDIAASASVFSMARASKVTESGGLVTAMANLGSGDGSFQQSTPANQPQMATDVDLGRETLTFADDQSKFLAYGQSVSYLEPWSMLAVFKYTGVLGGGVCVIGTESSLTADRACFQVVSTSRFRARIGTVYAQAGGGVAIPNQWYAGIASYNGTDRVSIWMPGRDIVTAVASDVATGGLMCLGDDQTAFGMRGAIDMAARFEVDVLDAANVALLDDIAAMLRRHYGGVLDGQS